jgi:hypothetical protein
MFASFSFAFLSSNIWVMCYPKMLAITQIYEAVKMLCDEFYIINQFENHEEYQQYYHSHYEWYISLDDCYKIWDYYNTNKDLIIEVIKEYKEVFN